MQKYYINDEVYFINSGYNRPIIDCGIIKGLGPEQVVIVKGNEVYTKYYDQIALINNERDSML